MGNGASIRRVVSVLGLAVGVVAAACGGTNAVKNLNAGDATADGAGGHDGGDGGDGASKDSTIGDGPSGDSTLADGPIGTDAPGADGGIDGATGGDGSMVGEGGGADAGIDGNHPGCFNLGAMCTMASDCCSATCTGGVCNPPACTSDNLACATSGQCCSGNCAGGACVPLPPTGCGKTLGNACAQDSECCSGLCQNGVCAVSSFCGQNGDMCSQPTDCCGGVCTIANGQTKGICSQPPAGMANCTMVDGTLCGGVGADGGIGSIEGGLPSCGGSCCSRLCAPYGPTGVFVCQPASGCHVVGDLCSKDTDCCGSVGMPTIPNGGPVTCTITPPNVVGVCGNPTGCKPNGDICKLPTTSCNASCDCCAGMAGGGMSKCDTDCRQDNLGVPRCTGPTCLPAGSSCASSADCCNDVPCVPNPAAEDGGSGPPFICYSGSCVPSCGGCTTSADCCPGETCVTPQASTNGVCGPCVPPPDGGTGDASAGDGSTGDGSAGGDGGATSDAGGTGEGGSMGDGGSGSDASKDGGGTSTESGVVDTGPAVCSLLGQECTSNAQCCNGIPCSYFNSPCVAGDVGCTCHFTIQ